jgi:predicted dehydrogenase
MNLPEGVFYRPRQEHLIAKDQWATIWIKTETPGNELYAIRERTFEVDIAPFLHGPWAEFDRLFRLDPQRGIYRERQQQPSTVVFSSAEHKGTPKKPNITVVPNLSTKEGHGLKHRWTVLGSTMGHYHLPIPSGYRVQEVYEFQTYGMLVLDREQGEVEMWVAQAGDKVAVPNGCHMTLYNFADENNPLITLVFTNPQENYADKKLVSRSGPILLAYYNDFEVVFVLNRFYINSSLHRAGVRLPHAPTEERDQRVRLARGVRLELGRFLYEEFTGDHELIAQFARLGIRIRQASSETVLVPPETSKNSRLYFCSPLVDAVKAGTEVYRYFFKDAEEGRPEKLVRKARVSARFQSQGEDTTDDHPQSLIKTSSCRPLNRPLVIVVEGSGDWVEKAYRKLFEKKRKEERELSVFYADDTRWSKKIPAWADATSPKYDLKPWEVYLDKADLDDFDKYRLLRPDVVFVVTPDFTHSVIARWWLGKAPVVFIEKPFDSQVKNVDDLILEVGQQRNTAVFGLDHYQFYALPVNDPPVDIDEHLGGALAKVVFYLTEDRALERNRVRSLQYGLTLDLLPHLFALLKYFGEVSTIDEIRVLEAGRYFSLGDDVREETEEAQGLWEDLPADFYNETYSCVQFTFHDNSRNGYHIPCLAIVGKGFAQPVKYLEVTGQSGNAIRIDLNERPVDQASDYPWDSLFYMLGESSALPYDAELKNVPCPYDPKRTLRILHSSQDPNRFCPRLARARYEHLLDSILGYRNSVIENTLSLTEGRDIVLALDRIWWAIQATRRSWIPYPLRGINPVEAPLHNAAQPLSSMPSRITSAEKEMIIPRRSYGANPRHMRDSVGLTSGPMRTRGDILLRGEDSAPAPAPPMLLSDLVEKLREELGQLPLTIMIHNWGSTSAQTFLDVLDPWLQRGDAIWLIPIEEMKITTTLPELEGVVMLKLNRPIDQRIYSNILGDLVFFPAEDEAEATHDTQFMRPTRAILVDQRGASAAVSTVTAHALSLKLVTYVWNGAESVAEFKGAESTGELSVPEAATTPSPDEIGQLLKHIASHLEKLILRRRLFQARLKKFTDRAEIPNWDEVLVRQAHQHYWPQWAVECLPCYIPLQSFPDGSKRALVWKYVIDCLPSSDTYQSVEKLCNDQIHLVHMAAEIIDRAESFGQIFEDCLRPNPYLTDGAFEGTIDYAMQQIEARYPEAAPKTKAVREEFKRVMLARR